MYSHILVDALSAILRSDFFAPLAGIQNKTENRTTGAEP
jgi:hypothetical protein